MTMRAAPGGLLSGDRRGLTIGLVLAVTLVAFEALAVATVLPRAERELGGLRFYGWTFSAFLLMSLLGITWAGEQCDRHGPARSFVAGLVLFAVGLVVSGLSPSMEVLVVGRAIQGLGAGAIPAVAYVSIGRGYEDSQRARMLAILSTAWVVPSLAGPAIASVVADYVSWRAVFLGLLPLLIVVTVLTARPLRRLGAPEKPVIRQGRMLRSLQLATGAAMLLGGLSLAPDAAWAGVPLVAGGAGHLRARAAAVASRRSAPRSWPRSLGDRGHGDPQLRLLRRGGVRPVHADARSPHVDALRGRHAHGRRA